ncbi:hypothetical protein JOD57_003470 [Geodermatophilus bullaregiensis]|uniref:hypothetical protein n=1 Tax=Geodermatophilus bullaregiensis TaxID=1564160 RepID=UPI001957F205|nr:hypothetical protein [Geodermatophilus bullaregiensis]MBM7807633.1 hypothetical protein [Geodermatophilus bullaregiensis]
MRVRRGVDRWLPAAGGLTLGLGAVSAGLPAVTSSGLTTGTGELRLHLDVIEEDDLPTWWATTVLVLAAACCAVVAGLHERLHRLVGLEGDGGLPFLRLVPGAVVGALLLLVVGALPRSAPRSTRRWMGAGLGLLLSGLGGELVQGLLLADASTGPAYVLAHHAEEAGETLGALAVLRAAAVRIGVVRAGAGWPAGSDGARTGAATRPGAPPGAAVTLR